MGRRKADIISEFSLSPFTQVLHLWEKEKPCSYQNNHKVFTFFYSDFMIQPFSTRENFFAFGGKRGVHRDRKVSLTEYPYCCTPSDFHPPLARTPCPAGSPLPPTTAPYAYRPPRKPYPRWWQTCLLPSSRSSCRPAPP